MRKDILEGVILHIMNETKPNYSALAKQYNCDYRTVKRYFETGMTGDLSKALTPQKKLKKFYQLAGFEELIEEKLALTCSYTSIYYFIQKKGYNGSYDTVRRFCRKTTKETIKKATIRIETHPGLSAQVDWKEDIKLVTRSGEVLTVNIFLYVLGYSRMKYLEITLDRKQKTLFQCLNHAFIYTDGVPKEIWFDNMKTVVDRSRSQYSQVKFNETFRQYSKQAGFLPIACRPFRPQTKGKVEALARTVDRLKVFNHEFDSIEELKQLTSDFMEDLNVKEISQATKEPPFKRWLKEKHELSDLDSLQLSSFVEEPPLTRKVSKEALVQFENQKYSVPVRYLETMVRLQAKDGLLQIYSDEVLVRTHPLTEKLFNYHREDYVDVLRSDVFKQLEDEELERFVDENLEAYDYL